MKKLFFSLFKWENIAFRKIETISWVCTIYIQYFVLIWINSNITVALAASQFIKLNILLERNI